MSRAVHSSSDTSKGPGVTRPRGDKEVRLGPQGRDRFVTQIPSSVRSDDSLRISVFLPSPAPLPIRSPRSTPRPRLDLPTLGTPPRVYDHDDGWTTHWNSFNDWQRHGVTGTQFSERISPQPLFRFPSPLPGRTGSLTRVLRDQYRTSRKPTEVPPLHPDKLGEVSDVRVRS